MTGAKNVILIVSSSDGGKCLCHGKRRCNIDLMTESTAQEYKMRIENKYYKATLLLVPTVDLPDPYLAERVDAILFDFANLPADLSQWETWMQKFHVNVKIAVGPEREEWCQSQCVEWIEEFDRIHQALEANIWEDHEPIGDSLFVSSIELPNDLLEAVDKLKSMRGILSHYIIESIQHLPFEERKRVAAEVALSLERQFLE